MVKIFLDTANIDEIREAASWGVLDGVTTNPTLVAKTGRKWSEVIQDILALVDGPISLEVTTTQADDMIKQGRQLAKLHQNVVVKIQMTTEGLKAIKALSSEGVRINTTLIFSSNQAILAAKAGAKYVSPFIGRLDDMGQEGMQVIRESGVIWYRNVAGKVLDLRNVFGPESYWTRRSRRTRLSSSSMTSSGLTSRMLANSSLFVIPLPSRRAANTRMRCRRSFRTFRFFSPAIIASTA